jgi:hypothetical protein
MNPTISREMNLVEKSKLRNEAKMIMRDAETKTMEQCSFQPEINQWDFNDNEISQEERWRRLLEPKTTKVQQLEKAKADKERKDFQKQ